MKGLYNTVSFSVSCPECGIEEEMMFRSKKLRNSLDCSSSIKLKSKVPAFYVFVPTTTVNADGTEIKSIFQPKKTLTCDGLPEKCPICGKELNFFPMHFS